MTTRRSLVVGLTWALGIASTGCGSADGSASGESLATAGSAPIVEWEAYRASAKAVPDGLLVEWDLVFPDEAALYEYWQEEYAGGAGQALTVNRIIVNNVEQ